MPNNPTLHTQVVVDGVDKAKTELKGLETAGTQTAQKVKAAFDSNTLKTFGRDIEQVGRVLVQNVTVPLTAMGTAAVATTLSIMKNKDAILSMTKEGQLEMALLWDATNKIKVEFLNLHKEVATGLAPVLTDLQKTVLKPLLDKLLELTKAWGDQSLKTKENQLRIAAWAAGVPIFISAAGTIIRWIGSIGKAFDIMKASAIGAWLASMGPAATVAAGAIGLGAAGYTFGKGIFMKEEDRISAFHSNGLRAGMNVIGSNGQIARIGGEPMGPFIPSAEEQNYDKIRNDYLNSLNKSVPSSGGGGGGGGMAPAEVGPGTPEFGRHTYIPKLSVGQGAEHLKKTFGSFFSVPLMHDADQISISEWEANRRSIDRLYPTGKLSPMQFFTMPTPAPHKQSFGQRFDENMDYASLVGAAIQGIGNKEPVQNILGGILPALGTAGAAAAWGSAAGRWGAVIGAGIGMLLHKDQKPKGNDPDNPIYVKNVNDDKMITLLTKLTSSLVLRMGGGQGMGDIDRQLRLQGIAGAKS
jgi:hypothetical protein